MHPRTDGRVKRGAARTEQRRLQSEWKTWIEDLLAGLAEDTGDLGERRVTRGISHII